MSEQTINLDCAPGALRPGDLIDGVVEGMGFSPREPVAKLFGNWTWDYSDIDPKTWQDTKATRKERVEALYHSGAIRYGDW